MIYINKSGYTYTQPDMMTFVQNLANERHHTYQELTLHKIDNLISDFYDISISGDELDKDIYLENIEKLKEIKNSGYEKVIYLRDELDFIDLEPHRFQGWSEEKEGIEGFVNTYFNAIKIDFSLEYYEYNFGDEKTVNEFYNIFNNTKKVNGKIITDNWFLDVLFKGFYGVENCYGHRMLDDISLIENPNEIQSASIKKVIEYIEQNNLAPVFNEQYDCDID